MPEWETLNKTDWLDRIAEQWMTAGAAALRSRGEFIVAMDASDECLSACRHLATLDWPWSATTILPVRENCVPPKHSRHCGTAIFKALYPRKAQITSWETEHLGHQQSAERYAKHLKKEGGDHPKIDLTLIALSGDHAWGGLEGTSPEYELTAVYQVQETKLPSIALTPWMLQATRQLVCMSQGLNPPVMASEDQPDLAFDLLNQTDHPVLLHTR